MFDFRETPEGHLLVMLDDKDGCWVHRDHKEVVLNAADKLAMVNPGLTEAFITGMCMAAGVGARAVQKPEPDPNQTELNV